MNIPNFLTMLRFVMTFGFLYLFPINRLASAALFVLAAVTDFFDGYVARKYNLITSFGKIMDPIADKFLILSAFAVLAIVMAVPWWMFWIIAVREIGITMFRFLAMAQGKVLAAETAGKFKTVFQISTICLMLFLQISAQGSPDFFRQSSVIPVIGALSIAFLWVSVIITIISGMLVIWNNRYVFKEDRK